jgi:hypothetical protein
VLLEDPADESNPWGRGLFRVTTVDERVELFNSIFDYRGDPTNFELMSFKEPSSDLEQGGHLVVGTNYIRADWQRNWNDDQAYYTQQLVLGADGEFAELEGSETFVSSPAEPVDWQSLRPAAALADLGQAIPDVLVQAGHSVDYQYDPTIGDPRQPLTQIRRRTVVGQAAALGAVEEAE